jgi:hypothetical protein
MSETELPDDQNLAEFMRGRGSYIPGTIEKDGIIKRSLIYKPADGQGTQATVDGRLKKIRKKLMSLVKKPKKES